MLREPTLRNYRLQCWLEAGLVPEDQIEKVKELIYSISLSPDELKELDLLIPEIKDYVKNADPKVFYSVFEPDYPYENYEFSESDLDLFKRYVEIQVEGKYNMITEGRIVAAILGIDESRYVGFLWQYPVINSHIPELSRYYFTKPIRKS